MSTNRLLIQKLTESLANSYNINATKMHLNLYKWLIFKNNIGKRMGDIQ